MLLYYPEMEIKASPPLSRSKTGPIYKLLIIDDEPEVREAIRGVLYDRFDVFTASNGRDGLKIACENRPDVILLDIIMPEMDGIAVCRSLRANPATQDISIIMMTATQDDDRRARALLAGADDLASKPFRPREFLVRIDNQIRRSREKTEIHSKKRIVSCGNLTLDFGKLQATVNNQLIDLTVLEFNLLRFFIKNKDQILKRDIILDAFWDEKEVSDRVVDNHILWLRKKLQGFDHELISVYGAGYGLRRRSNARS